MAFDKAVDSAVLDAGLTAIANAIREKAGTEGALAFPDGLVEAIGAIESGSAIATGEFTMSADAKYYEIAHGLGKTPTILVFWVTTYVNTANSLAGGIGVLLDNFRNNIPICNKGTQTTTHVFYPGSGKGCAITDNVTGVLSTESAFTLANEETFQIGSDHGAYDYYLRSGKTYRWIAMG